MAGKNKQDYEVIVFKKRQLFLFDEIESCLAEEIVEKLWALDHQNHNPITLFINSPGGSVSDGFAIIDTMLGIASPVITVITGEACSMAGLISVAGNKRFITENSYWMGHSMTGGSYDYIAKASARMEYLKTLQNRIDTLDHYDGSR